MLGSWLRSFDIFRGFIFLVLIGLTLGLSWQYGADIFVEKGFATVSSESSPGLVSFSKRPQILDSCATSRSSSDFVIPSFSRSETVGAPFTSYHGESREGVVALWLVLETLQAEPSAVSGLRHLLGRQGHHLHSPESRCQFASKTATVDRRRWGCLESMEHSVVLSAATKTSISTTQPKQRSQRQRKREEQGQGFLHGQRATIWTLSSWYSASCSTLAALSCTFQCSSWFDAPGSFCSIWRCSTPWIPQRDEEDPGHACRCAYDHSEVCEKAALRDHQKHASICDGPERCTRGSRPSSTGKTSATRLLAHLSWRSLGDMAGLHWRFQTTGGCSSCTHRRRQAEPSCCQRSLRRLSQHSHRLVQERPAADRECRSCHGSRANGRSHCCSTSTRSGIDAWASHRPEEQRRCNGSGCQHIFQEAKTCRTTRSNWRCRGWGIIKAWAFGAFWLGPQVTSASLSPCEGLVAPEVSHAAVMAWTHSILHDPSFTTVWQASFRALCLSFDLGTLQPRTHYVVKRTTSHLALGNKRQVKFNPNVSVALGLDVDWNLHSFDISESALSTWTDKPWSGRRIKKPQVHRNADDRLFPLRHLPLDGQEEAPRQDAPAGPFLHEAPQSIQDLFQTFLEEDLIEGEELQEPVFLRS